MPVMNGLIASQQIRQMHASGELSSHLPILGVSANVRGPQGMALGDPRVGHKTDGSETVQAMRDAGMVRIWIH